MDEVRATFIVSELWVLDAFLAFADVTIIEFVVSKMIMYSYR